MSSQTLSLHFPDAPTASAPGTSRPPGRHTGIAVALLLHLLVALLLWQQIAQPTLPLAAPAAPKGEAVIDLLDLQARLPVAAPAPVAAPEAPPPVVEAPRPPVRLKPKPAPIKKPATLIAAPSPVPSPQPLPHREQQEQQQQQQRAAEPAAAAVASPSVAAVAAAPAPPAGAFGGQRLTLTQADIDRLEYAYKLAISRAIASRLKGAVLMQQLGGAGQAMVRLTLARDGRVLDATLLRGTGYRHLDDEARFVATRIGRFQPAPSLLRPDNPTIVIDQPVSFIPR